MISHQSSWPSANGGARCEVQQRNGTAPLSAARRPSVVSISIMNVAAELEGTKQRDKLGAEKINESRDGLRRKSA